MILSIKWITKVLIRLRECASWSVPLLFTKPEDRFSRICSYLLLKSNMASGSPGCSRVELFTVLKAIETQTVHVSWFVQALTLGRPLTLIVRRLRFLLLSYWISNPIDPNPFLHHSLCIICKLQYLTFSFSLSPAPLLVRICVKIRNKLYHNDICGGWTVKYGMPFALQNLTSLTITPLRNPKKKECSSSEYN